MIVLQWHSSESCRYKTFVGNRVYKIQTLTLSCKWLDIPSKNNPADILSRGVTDLSNLWWWPFLSFKNAQIPRTYSSEILSHASPRKISCIQCIVLTILVRCFKPFLNFLLRRNLFELLHLFSDSSQM